MCKSVDDVNSRIDPRCNCQFNRTTEDVDGLTGMDNKRFGAPCELYKSDNMFAKQ